MPESEFDPNAPIARLAAELVTALGEGWTLDTDKSMPHFCYLDGPDHVRIGLRDVDNAGLSGQELGKVTAYGIYPDKTRTVVHGVTNHEINMNGTRPVAALARDLVRRLVPLVAAEMVTIRARLDEFETDRAARHAARDTLAAALGGRPGPETDTATSSEIDFDVPGSDAYGTVRLNHDGTRASELNIRSLPTDLAMRIAAILQP